MKISHGGFHDPVVTPAQDWGGDERGPAHCRLHHFECPGDRRTCPTGLGPEPELGHTLEIAVNSRVDYRWPNTSLEDDTDTHAIRQRRRDDPGEGRAGLKSGTVKAEFSEAAPPLLERVDLLDRLPHLFGWNSEMECPLIAHHISRHRG